MPNGEGAFIVRPNKSRDRYCLSYKRFSKEHNDWQYEHINLEIGAGNQHVWFEDEDTR